MSLDVYLTRPNLDRQWEPVETIYLLVAGSVQILTPKEWSILMPGAEIVVPGTKYLGDTIEVYSGNFTHNLAKMAEAAGIYKHLWRPDEVRATKARHLIDPLRKGIKRLKSDPAKFKAFNPENGWGRYECFLPWVKEYLSACENHPDSDVSVSG